jgi:predicted O-methyltransferase YrrM
MNSTLAAPQTQALLAKLYQDAQDNHAASRKDAMALPETATRDEFYTAMRGAYMCIGADFGNLLYSLARTSQAKSILEFGTSFGVSTIYLASAMRDNGGGKVITSEFLPEKVERAKKNLAEAGLIEYVEFRTGDALETLKQSIPTLDMVFLDGPKDMYLGVLKLVEGKLRSGGIVASDNTSHKGLESFLAYVRDAGNSYVSSAIVTQKNDMNSGHEISVKLN